MNTSDPYTVFRGFREGVVNYVKIEGWLLRVGAGQRAALCDGISLHCVSVFK